MEISNNYNINFGAKFGPNLKKQLNRREGNGNPLYADFVEDTFVNNERLEISHEFCPEIKSKVWVKVPKKSTLSQRILDIPAIKYIVAQSEVLYRNVEESHKSAKTLEIALMSETCTPATQITDAQIDFYTSLKDEVTRALNNIETIDNEFKLKQNSILEQVKIAKAKSCK